MVEVHRIYLTEGIVCHSVLLPHSQSSFPSSNCCLVPLDSEGRRGGVSVGARREISGAKVRSWRWRIGHGVTGETFKQSEDNILNSFDCVSQFDMFQITEPEDYHVLWASKPTLKRLPRPPQCPSRATTTASSSSAPAASERPASCSGSSTAPSGRPTSPQLRTPTER